MKRLLFTLTALLSLPVFADEASRPDLPRADQVNAALRSNINVITAETQLSLAQSQQRKLDLGNHEFNFRASSGQRHIVNSGRLVKEWNVAVERPIRLFDKSRLDGDIGAAGTSRAEYALGDARHEAGRLLLHLWFNWLREQAKLQQWQHQTELLQQQVQITEQRLRAGDVPRMELNQARTAVAQAEVSRRQAEIRSELAAAELHRQFPALRLPEHAETALPVPVAHSLNYWKSRFLADNHRLGMAQSESRIQELSAQRSRADRLPDPTVGIYYANEMGGNERVTYLTVSVPFSFGLRSARAEGAGYQAKVAAEQEVSVRQQLESDIYSTYTQAKGSYAVWQQAHEAASGALKNAELATRAYRLGESGLSNVLDARRQALESALSEVVAKFDANEARYRLLLDTHQLWPLEPGKDGN